MFGQRKLLKWNAPGLAHFFTFWGFVVLGATIVEAYGALVWSRDFAFPIFGRARWLGFLEDFFAVAVLLGIIYFAINRLRNAPARKQRASRFYGSHNGPAWMVLGFIAAVVVTLLMYRGAQSATGHFPYGHSKWPFASYLIGKALGHGAWLTGFETFWILAQMAVIFSFTVLVVYSKHLHIGTAPLNVLTKREPDALRELLPVTDDTGKAIDFADVENLSEDTVFGKGKIEDFTWKGYLDFATCTECGRCQSQCPAWNTGKPLSPKLVIMNLRDHLFAKAPYIFGQEVPEDAEPNFSDEGVEHVHGVPESGFERVQGSGIEQAVRPLVGTAEQGGVIDPDVLWSCTTCGACVEQCPVDIEHIDHIVDMRRYQVLIESAFPSEAGVMLRNIENKGNPWGMGNAGRDDWMSELSFEVRRAEPGSKLDADIDYLFWVGCAGALEDRSKKVTVAFAELLHTAGVEFAVLGQAESCTGDPARRLGNEFLFQMQGMQNVETLNSVERHGPLKIVATCPHCFNTLANEYPQLGGHYEVVHHTQLLAKLVDEGPADARRAGGQEGHLPRPVLPRPAQQGLHAAARGAGRDPGPAQPGDAPLQGTRLLLRRGRCPLLDGGEDRQAGQCRAHRRGARPGPRPDLDGLPVLHGDAVRRGRREGRRGRGPRGRQGARRRADPAPVTRRARAAAGDRERRRPRPGARARR